MRTRCLSIHARYACQHRGACCRADWTIEADDRIVSAVRSGTVLPLTAVADPFQRSSGVARAVMARGAHGDCVFHAADRCQLQLARGESMLPSACRHFPRVLLIDGRGVSLTLSHFCPTAAALLIDDGPVRIVDAAPPLAPAEPLEGLDARTAFPPLLHPEMLMDLEGYDRWETRAVQTFTGTRTAAGAIARIAQATEHLRQWTPSDGPLTGAVDAAFASAHAPEPRPALSRGFEIVRELTGPHPDIAVPRRFESAWRRLDASTPDAVHRAIGRYMAAATFGNWIAYRGRGLRTIVEWLRACFDVLRVQLVRESAAGGGALTRDVLIASFRKADYLLVHTVDSLAFGRAAAVIER